MTREGREVAQVQGESVKPIAPAPRIVEDLERDQAEIDETQSIFSELRRRGTVGCYIVRGIG